MANALRLLAGIALLCAACGDSDDSDMDSGAVAQDASAGADTGVDGQAPAESTRVCGATETPGCPALCADISECVAQSGVAEMILDVLSGFGFAPDDPTDCSTCLERCEAANADGADMAVLECFYAETENNRCEFAADPTVAANTTQTCCADHPDSPVCQFLCGAILPNSVVSELVPACMDVPNQSRPPTCAGQCPEVNEALALPVDADGLWTLVGSDVHTDGRVAVLLNSAVTLDLGDGPHNILGSGSTQVLAVYEADGGLAWSRTMGGNFGAAEGTLNAPLGFDPSGNLMVGARLSGSADFGDGSVSADGPSDALVLSYSPAGALRWQHLLGGSGGSRITSIWVGADHTLAVGSFEDALDAGAQSFAGSGDSDMFAMRLDAAGTLQWVRAYGGVGNDIPAGVAGLPGGDHLLFGTYFDGTDFGDGPLQTDMDGDGFVVRFADDGAVRWQSLASGDGWQFCYQAVPMNSGIAAHCFTTMGTSTVGGTEYTDAAQVLHSLDSDDGAPATWRHYGQTPAVIPHVLEPHAAGGVAFLGSMGGSADLGGGQLDTVGRDLLLARFGPGGEHLWSTTLGGFYPEEMGGGGYLPSGELVVVGQFRDVLDYGAGELSQAGSNLFILRYAAE